MSTLLTNASIMSFPSFFSDVANIIGSTILTKQTYTRRGYGNWQAPNGF